MTPPDDAATGDTMTVAEVREAIDGIDDQILDLLGRRAALIERAVALKVREGIPALAPDRFQSLMARIRERADATGFPPGLAVRMWEEMVGYFVAVERQLRDDDLA